jgi:hypothetical protein
VEVAAPPATSVPASSTSATAAAPSEPAAPPAAAAAHRARNDAAAANRVGRERRRRVECEEREQEDVADAKADGACGEVMPRAAMVGEANGGKEESAGDKGGGDGNKRF